MLLMINLVDVWSVSADADSSPSDRSLSAEEKARLAGMASEKRRSEFLRSRTELRRIAAIYLGVPAGKVKIKIDALGKPSLDHGAGSPAISLSHSDGRLVFAVARGGPVGIDVERRRAVDVDRVASDYLGPGERERLSELGNEAERLALFFDFWTRKEAVSKFLGLGLRAQFGEIDCSRDPVEYRGERIFTEGFDWDDFRVAVAHGANAEIRWKGNLAP